jgi:hypothetical protein
MPEYLIVVIVLGLLVGGGCSIAYVVKRKRAAGMQLAALRLGFEFFANGDGLTLEQLAHFQLFSQGTSRRIRNLMLGGANQLEVKLFDYEYAIGSGENVENPVQSVICFRAPNIQLPSFSLRPRTLLYKIATLFGYQHIEFGDHPEFSRHYLLRGRDETAIRNHFHLEAVEFFECHPGLSVEGKGSLLICYRAGKRVEPAAVRSFLDEGFKILALWRD